MHLYLKYITREGVNRLTTKQASSATTCREVCLEEMSVCVRCLYPAMPSSSRKAEHLYADFNRTQRNGCACIPQLERGEMELHSRCDFDTVPVCFSTIFWAVVFLFI